MPKSIAAFILLFLASPGRCLPGQDKFMASPISSIGFYKDSPAITLLICLSFFLVAALLLSSYFLRKNSRNAIAECIRTEEQSKLRKRLAEDFHDEMSSRLTRISILSEVLKTKMDKDESKIVLLNQILENSTAIYTGTHDLIWSLTPESKSASQVMERIKSFGTTLFSECGIGFKACGVLPPLQLPPGHGHDLVMIFKEAMNNIIKHAQCSCVTLRAIYTGDKKIIITLSDNGKGLAADNLQKGNGLQNIKRRAERINATLLLNSMPMEGTAVALHLKCYETRTIIS